MTIIRKWSGNGLAPGTLTTSTAGTGDNAFAFVGAGMTVVAGGTRSPRIGYPGTSVATQARWSALGNLNAAAIREYISFTSVPSATISLIGAYDSLGANPWQVILTSTGKFRLRNGVAGVNYDSPAVTILPNTAYHVELVANASNTLATLRVHVGEETAVLAEVTATIPNLTLQELRWGTLSSTSNFGLAIDDLAVSDVDTYIGQAGTPIYPDIPAGDPNKRIAVIGDSLTFQNEAGEAKIRGLLVAAGWANANVWFYACSGKGIDYRDSNGRLTVEDIAQARSDLGAEPDLWIIALGTNGASAGTGANTSRVNVVMGAIGVGSAVIWISPGDRDASTSYADFNTVAKPLVEGTPNGIWADWQARALTLPTNMWNTDGLHMPPQGYDLRNAFYMEQIGVPDDWAEGSYDPGTEVPTLPRWSGDGLAAGPLTTAKAGTGDVAFTSVTGGPEIVAGGLRTPRIKLPDTAAIKRFGWWPLSSAPLTTYALRFYYSLDAYSTSEIYIANGLLAGAGAWSIRLTTTGLVRLRDDAAAVVRWTASDPIPLGVQVRIELVVSGGVATIHVYRSDYMLSLGSGGGTVGGGGIDELRLGLSSSVASSGVAYDDIKMVATDAEIGPAAAPPPPYTHFYYDGTAWKPLDVILL